MNEDTVRSILRLIAVVTILVGAVLVTITVLSLVGVSSTISTVQSGMRTQPTGLAKLGFFAVAANAMIAVWGALLYYLSPFIARRIVT